MLKAYVNYPNPKVSAHRDANCGQIQKMRKPGQRLVRIDNSSISVELQRFTGKRHTFAANKVKNDMWLEVDFADVEFEHAVLAYVHRLIGNHYSPLKSITVEQHC